MCWSGGNQLTDAALHPVGFVEASFDGGHQGPELCCCFEESESDCNGPSCAPACLPLRFTTHLIYSLQTLSHITVHCMHIFSLVYLYFTSLCLCHSLFLPSFTVCLPLLAHVSLMLQLVAYKNFFFFIILIYNVIHVNKSLNTAIDKRFKGW